MNLRRRRYGAAGIALFAGLSATLPVQAQDSAQTATKLNTVEVTGSRIKKSEGTGDTPVLTISGADLQATGIASIGDILQRLSLSGSSLNTKFNSAGNFGFPSDGGGVGSGSTTLSLRNLGANRTLILVDGLRWVNESSASGVSSAVDLNTIPVSAIERIEILTDGASSLYGSDAIGGVVNIITKKTQDGFLVHGYYGDYQIGDGKTYNGNISYGYKDKQLEFYLDFAHYQQQAVSSDVSEQSRFPVPGGGLAFGSSATPTGRFIFNGPGTDTFNGLCPLDSNGSPFCNITPNGVGSAFPDGYHRFTSADRFNFAPFNLLVTPSRRNSAFGQTRYKFNDNIRFSAKALFESRNSANQAAPEPIFLGAGAGLGTLADTIGVDATNPYNPFGFTLDPATNLTLIGRRPIEGGPRIFRQNVDTFYFSTGFDGTFELFNHYFSWDLNYVNSFNDAEQNVSGTYNIRHIKNALGPVANCVAPCVPLNIFGGPGSITQDQLNYILLNEHDTSRQNLDTFTANLSGDILQLPAGTLDFATGYEHRRLQGNYQPDAVIVAGDGNGVPSLPTRGAYGVDELYLELQIPVLAKLPLAKKVDLNIATRYSDYSTFGSTIKSKYGLRWQPFTDLTLRGNFAQGFRAPSIGEAFGSPARLDALIVDPCSNATDPRIIANCQTLGVGPGFEQVNNQISVRTGGNAALRPESSKSYTAGLVYSPSWAEKSLLADRIDFEATFYKHKIDNAIQAPDAQTQLDRCVDTLDPVFCSGITRGRTGDINGFNNTLRNLGTITTQGYDFVINWTAPRLPIGRFSTNWQTTYTQNYSAVATDSGLAEPRAVGVEVRDSGIPRWKSTFRLNWALKPFTASWAVRYLSSLTEQCGDATGLSTCSNSAQGTNKLGATVYNDFQASYALPELYKVKSSISIGVNNIFNVDPPVCVSCSLNGYDASNYDIYGRFGYVEATIRF